MEIQRLNFAEYQILFMGMHTPISRRFAAQAEKNGWIFGAWVGGSCAGFLTAEEETEDIRITHAFTVPSFRKKGVFTGLIRHMTEEQNRIIRVTVSSGNVCFPTVRDVCLSLGFRKGESVSVFVSSSRTKPEWNAFMKLRGERLCQTLKRQGYRALSFQDMDKDLLEQLGNSDRSEYGNVFHPSLYLENPAKRLDRDMSFAAVKDGKLAAYSLVAMGDDDSAVFDQISVSKEESGHGVILLPFACSMARFYERGIPAAYYAMYESNRHAGAFRSAVLEILPTEERTIENYFYIPKESRRAEARI